jgi:hypothetical protein
MGFWNDDRPTPSDLRRETMLAGDMVTLGDGNAWRVPTARLFPSSYAINGEGELELHRLSKYDEAYNRAERLGRQWIVAALPEMAEQLKIEEENVQDADLFSCAVDALAMNYRVGKYEAAALELFTTENIWRAITVFCHSDILVEAAKKNIQRQSEELSYGEPEK